MGLTVMFFLCTTFAVWRTRAEAVIHLPPNVTIPALIVFGDSIVDSGNNNHLFTLGKCNFAPYGKDFIGGNATGRFTNAKTPADIIATELEIKEFMPAYLDHSLQSKDLPTGVSFASGGSGYDPLTPRVMGVLSYTDQLKMFKEYIRKLKDLVGEGKTKFILANGVFFLVFGSNDWATTYYNFGRRLEYDVPAYADFLITTASKSIQEIYTLGVRKFAVFGVPPIGCLPFQRTTVGGFRSRLCVDNYNQAAQLYNSKLSPKLDSLTKSLAKSKVVYIDIYNPLFDIIQNPQNYGFDNVDKGCCSTGDIEAAFLCNRFSPLCPDSKKFLFWDSYHLTQQGYNILAKKILQRDFPKFFL